MGDIKKKRDAKEKAIIAIEAIKGELTAAQISSKYGVNSGQISTWKKQLLDGAIDIFSGKHIKKDKTNDTLVEEYSGRAFGGLIDLANKKIFKKK